jgi:hypothetical protein
MATEIEEKPDETPEPRIEPAPWRAVALFAAISFGAWGSVQWAPWLFASAYGLIMYGIPTAIILALAFPPLRRPILRRLARIAGWLYRTATGTRLVR